MFHIEIPDLYTLDRPAFYDEYRFKMHLLGVLTITKMETLYKSGHTLFDTFFREDDHAEIAIDLLRWVIDRNPRASKEIIIRTLIRSMYESGFFG